MKTLTLLILLTLISGCSNKTTKESFTLEKDGWKLTYRAEDASWSALSFSQELDSEFVSATTSRSTGSYMTQSDAESIESAGSFIGELMRGLIVK